jgi:hypothetical protein
MATAQARACTILVEFERVRAELVGEAVILTNGKDGIVDRLWLDEFHDLRISIRGQEGNRPISTIKFAEQYGDSGGTRSNRAAVQASSLISAPAMKALPQRTPFSFLGGSFRGRTCWDLNRAA